MKKLTYDQVKTYIESFGYTLLSEEYINNRLKLSLQCLNKHITNISFDNFNHGKRCSICRNNERKLTTDYVSNFINNEGFELLSLFIDTKHIMDIKCPNGHIFKRSFNGFQQGYRCPVCANDKKRLTYEYVKGFIEVNGYKLISTNYINARDKLTIQCPNNHQFNSTFSNSKLGSRCPLCVRITSKKEKEIVQYIHNIYKGIIIENDRTLIKNPTTNRMLELDIWLPDIRKAIEFNGIYWHSLDNVIERDVIKLDYCKTNNIQLLIINEHNWLKNKDIELDKIKNFIEC